MNRRDFLKGGFLGLLAAGLGVKAFSNTTELDPQEPLESPGGESLAVKYWANGEVFTAEDINRNFEIIEKMSKAAMAQREKDVLEVVLS